LPCSCVKGRCRLIAQHQTGFVDQRLWLLTRCMLTTLKAAMKARVPSPTPTLRSFPRPFDGNPPIPSCDYIGTRRSPPRQRPQHCYAEIEADSVSLAERVLSLERQRPEDRLSPPRSRRRLDSAIRDPEIIVVFPQPGWADNMQVRLLSPRSSWRNTDARVTRSHHFSHRGRRPRFSWHELSMEINLSGHEGRFKNHHLRMRIGSKRR